MGFLRGSLADLGKICHMFFFVSSSYTSALDPWWLIHCDLFVQNHLQKKLLCLSFLSRPHAQPPALRDVKQPQRLSSHSQEVFLKGTLEENCVAHPLPPAQDMWISALIPVIDSSTPLIKAALQQPL